MNQPDVKERFLAQGIDAAPMDAKEFGAWVQGGNRQVGQAREDREHQGDGVTMTPATATVRPNQFKRRLKDRKKQPGR